MARDRISIDELRVDCIVGIHAHERRQPQPLLLDLDLGLDLAEAGQRARIAATIDYGRVADELTALLVFRRYRLLEVAAEELAAALFGLHPRLEQLRLRLRKPGALGGRGQAAVELRREAGDFTPARAVTSFGERVLLHQTREAGLLLLHLDPGCELSACTQAAPQTLDWRVAGSLVRAGEPLRGSEATAWTDGHTPAYVNVGQLRASLFRCESPPRR